MSFSIQFWFSFSELKCARGRKWEEKVLWGVVFQCFFFTLQTFFRTFSSSSSFSCWLSFEFFFVSWILGCEIFSGCFGSHFLKFLFFLSFILFLFIELLGVTIINNKAKVLLSLSLSRLFLVNYFENLFRNFLVTFFRFFYILCLRNFVSFFFNILIKVADAQWNDQWSSVRLHIQSLCQ